MGPLAVKVRNLYQAEARIEHLESERDSTASELAAARRVLVSISSIEVDWRSGVVSAQEAMAQIAKVLRKSTEQ